MRGAGFKPQAIKKANQGEEEVKKKKSDQQKTDKRKLEESIDEKKGKIALKSEERLRSMTP